MRTISQADLAVRLRLAVARTARRLRQEAGLVARTRDPADGRSYLVALTPAARELLARVRTRKDVYLSRRLRELSPDDRATLDRAAAILERILEESDVR
jgi:DNA-binding MarR family transcriptional regulator